MKSSLVNSVRLLGNVGNNPEVKTFDDGNKVARFSLATNEIYYNKQKEKVTLTEWHSLTAWGKKAELIENYVTKGERLLIEGKLKYGNYTDKDGNLRYTTEIEVNEFQFIGSGKNSTETKTEKTKASKAGKDNLPF